MTPGEELSASNEITAAWGALRGARLLWENDLPADASSRLYYAVFHATRAMLTLRGRHARTHTGQIQVFRELYGNEPLLGELLELRASADYATQRFAVSPHVLDDLFARAAAFIDRCHQALEEMIDRGPDAADPPPDI